MKKLVILMVGIILCQGCCPELQMTPQELKTISTDKLIMAGGYVFGSTQWRNWNFDPEIEKELILRQTEDLNNLFTTATKLDDFRIFIYPMTSKASEIYFKYMDIPDRVKDGKTNKYIDVKCKIITSKKINVLRKEWYISQHSTLSEITKNAIINGKIFIGMKEEEVIASWGFPYEINRTTGSWGTHEQWLYGSPSNYILGRYYPAFTSSYCYFENGKLTTIQN